MRKIIHVDLDAFYASVEQRDDPSLRGRPVVVAWRGARSVVCAASYEAREFGVRSAMPALRAERLCPDAVFVPPDFPRYKEASRQIRGIFARYAAMIEPLSLDEAYLDVSRPLIDLGSATAIARAIRAEILAETGLTASAGIAPNKYLAKIASDWNKPNGQFVIRPEQAEDFLTPLPVGKLPGVGRVTETRMAELGVKTVGDLRALPLPALQAAFGRYGERLFELSRGIDDHPVCNERPTQSISAEDTFAEDLPLAATGETIERLSERVWQAQQRERRIGRSVVLKLKTREFRLLTRTLTPAQPPHDLGELVRIALGLRQRVDLPNTTRYRLVGVGLTNFDEIASSQALQAELFPG
ncbi:DNA polymerase IV [Pseudomarimonas salicorniae]|uniref:DNA polymerase IV n=1 Tax=Pseudomarimonas salicorniae TaxID=2933270 RepID=A0ABT0GI47_9GAMM|nr:DNA polymerase IV [Lysobacter sp. CAU 1642]MCK7594205.1 DNA polymerase IV [Lysobacter sp. CAU 1642]